MDTRKNENQRKTQLRMSWLQMSTFSPYILHEDTKKKSYDFLNWSNFCGSKHFHIFINYSTEKSDINLYVRCVPKYPSTKFMSSSKYEIALRSITL